MDRKFRFYEIDTPHYVLTETPHQSYDAFVHSIDFFKCDRGRKKPDMLFVLDGVPIEEKDKESFKERLRNGEFFQYSLKKNAFFSSRITDYYDYILYVYTKDYYNEHIKDKEKKE